VLAGNKEKVEFSGNRCTATVTKNETVLEDLYEDMEGMESYVPYKIKTSDLLQLIDMWLDKISKNR